MNALADPVLDKALETARELAAKSPVALALAKRLVNLSPGALDTKPTRSASSSRARTRARA